MTSTAPERDQGLGDLQGLLAGVRLGDEQVVDVHAELAGVDGIQRVLGVHEGRHAALPAAISAMTCRARVVLPEDSGPKISTTRPRGMPPMPSASVQRDRIPVEIAATFTFAESHRAA